MNPRVLVVEDNPIQLAGIVQDLEGIHAEHEQLYGLGSFEVTKARTVSEAKAALERAASEGHPFDLLLLDLSLPRDDDHVHEGPEMGFCIMQHAVSLAAAREIIICSVFSTSESVLRAFRGGAVDFISKPYTTVQLQQRVLAAWQRGLVRQSAQIFDRRLRTLIPFAGKGYALRFSTCLSNLVQSIAPCIEEMQTCLSQPGAKALAQEPIAISLRIIEDAVGDAKNDWTRLQASLGGAIEAVRPAVIEKLLNSMVSELMPCLAVKRVAVRVPTNGSTVVLALGEEVQVVLTEIIAGALNELPDHPEQQTSIGVTIDVSGQRAYIRFRDEMPPISPETANLINDGYRIVQDPCYGREWGLSVAQHLALSVGGRILVEPMQNGNTVSYALPVPSV